MSHREAIREACLELAWSLWGELGVAAPRRRHADCAVDLEALIVFTHTLRDLDPRLEEEALRAEESLAGHISQTRLSRASKAIARGVSQRTVAETVHERPRLAPLPLRSASLLQLRLRAIFGVSARAEVVLALLASHPHELIASEIAASALLAKSMVSRALTGMAATGVLHASRDANRIRFRLARAELWQGLVGPIPRHIPSWAPLFEFITLIRAAFEQHCEESVGLLVELRRAIKVLGEVARPGIAAPDPKSKTALPEWCLRVVNEIADGTSPLLGFEALVEWERDVLTKLANRRALHDHIEVLLGGHEPVAVALIDVDHFKTINDRWGHHVGDDVLTWLAGILRESTHGLRSGLCARYGGEEFAVACVGTIDDAVRASEAIQARLAAEKFERGKLSISVTVSVGCAASHAPRPRNAAADLFRVADEALYRAKSRGRNRIEW